MARAKAYIEAGADMLFPEALTELPQYEAFTKAFPNIPVLANLTEFGKTPFYTTEQLANVGVGIALYPLSAFRAMNAGALNVYKTILQDGTQEKSVPTMQTREELYKFLNYHEYEDKLDTLFGKSKK